MGRVRVGRRERQAEEKSQEHRAGGRRGPASGSGSGSVAAWAPGGQVWDWLPGSGACEIGCDRLGTNPDSLLHSTNSNVLSTQNLDEPVVTTVTTTTTIATTHPPLCVSMRVSMYEPFRHAMGGRLQTGWCVQAMAGDIGLLCVLLPAY